MLYRTEAVEISRLVGDVKHLNDFKTIDSIIDSLNDLVLDNINQFLWQTISLIVKIAQDTTKEILYSGLHHLLNIGYRQAVLIREIVNQEVINIGNLHLQAYANLQINNLGFNGHRDEISITLLIDGGTKKQIKDTCANKSNIDSTISLNFFDILLDALLTLLANFSFFLVFSSCKETPYTSGRITKLLNESFVLFVLCFFLLCLFLSLFLNRLRSKFVITTREHTHHLTIHRDNGSYSFLNNYPLDLIKLSKFRF